jgi:amino acid transporter
MIQMGSEQKGEFRRVLGYRDLLIYGMTYMVPIAPWVIFGFLDKASGQLPALAYLLGVLCMYFTARSYATMVGQLPKAGSVDTYARTSLGPVAGCLAGWLMPLDYILFPSLACVFASVSLNSQITQVPRLVWVVALVGFTLVVNWFGISVTARVAAASFWVQITALIVFMAAGVLAMRNGAGAAGCTLAPLWHRQVDGHRLLSGTALCMMSFLGFDAISTLTEEVRPGHQRLVGRAIVTSLLLIGSLFVLQTWLMSNLLVGFQVKDLASLTYDLSTARMGSA